MAKKKEKIIYIDDGRTIADMSGVTDGFRFAKTRSRSTAKEKWQTYWGTVKMMLLPTLVFGGALLIIFLVMYGIFVLM